MESTQIYGVKEREGSGFAEINHPRPRSTPPPLPQLVRRNVHRANIGRDLEMWGTGQVEPPAAKPKETLQQGSLGLLTQKLVKAPSSHCPAAQPPAPAKTLCLDFK